MRAMESTVTSKGQATIPKEVRKRLGLKAGSRVKFFIDMDGRVELLATRPASELRGILKSPRKRPVSLKEMDEGIAAAVVARFRRSGRK
jgi:AbrB family looped-hinge helix DNA binding protein